jgi:hypothetical protein
MHYILLNGKAVGLTLGNSVPCGNPDSALDSTFSYTFSYCSAPGEPERILRNRG